MQRLDVSFHILAACKLTPTVWIRTEMPLDSMGCVYLLKMSLHFSLLTRSILASLDGTGDWLIVVLKVMTEITRKLKR